MTREQPRVELSHAVCPCCKDPVRPTDEKAACDACMAWHHLACWREHGVCGACGASAGFSSEPAPPPSVPQATCVEEGCDLPRTTREFSDPLERSSKSPFCARHNAERALQAPRMLQWISGGLACMGLLVLLLCLGAGDWATGLGVMAVTWGLGLVLLFVSFLALGPYDEFEREAQRVEAARESAQGADEEQLDGEPGAHGTEQP